jgi:hypothetical protein
MICKYSTEIHGNSIDEKHYWYPKSRQKPCVGELEGFHDTPERLGGAMIRLLAG